MAAIAPDAEREVFSVLRERAERNSAERESVLDVLEQLVACINDKAWTPPEVQGVVSNARAVLAQHGRKVR